MMTALFQILKKLTGKGIMRKLSIILLVIAGHGRLFAQRPCIDSAAICNWPFIGHTVISNDGKYTAYTISSQKGGNQLVIQSTGRDWKKVIHGSADEIRFSDNSHWLLYNRGIDSVGIFDLLGDSLRYIEQVSNLSVSNGKSGPWIACQTGKDKSKVAVINLESKEEKTYEQVKSCLFSPKAHILVMETETLTAGIKSIQLTWHNLATGTDTLIAVGSELSNLTFDNSGEELCFLTAKKQGNSTNIDLRYYKAGMDSASILVNSDTKGMEGKMVSIDKDIFFGEEGNKIFFYTEQQRQEEKKEDSTIEKAHVRVQNYQDDTLQFERKNGPYLSMVNLKNDQPVIQLGQKNDNGFTLGKGNHMVVTSNGIGSPSDYFWRPSSRPDIYLVSAKDGSRKLLRKRLVLLGDASFSPMSKYVYWYDRLDRNWYAYNIKTCSLKNVSYSFNSFVFGDLNHIGHLRINGDGMAGWTTGDQSMLIYDQYDIWKVDPDGIKLPVNITQGYGLKHHICLRLTRVNDYGDENNPHPFSTGDTLLLTAFNVTTKANSFFKLPLSSKGALIPILTDPKLFYSPHVTAEFCGADQYLPIKAKDTDVYIVRRMSAREYPNLSVTNDFKTFKTLSDLRPQKNYNWYTSELIRWLLPGGQTAEGLVYKPENFDPRKNYPVIFYYYERNSDALNVFIHPVWSNGQMNIPWFVSRGYVVVVPDIYYLPGHPGKGVCNSIILAAQYMAKFPWADARRFGLQGHSFGGWETNEVIAHTSLFAAAASASGLSDVINQFEGYLPDDSYYSSDHGQGRIGATLWQNPESYIENSPIFRADKVTTPELIMHNANDGAVPWIQESGWYGALSRLRKKAWMLSYDNEGHTIAGEKNQQDYTIRLTQFFNYYLKGALPPIWMTQGIDPGSMADGLQIDRSGRIP